MFLWDFVPCKTVYDYIICRYKYVSDFVTVGVKLLNIETKETRNNHTRVVVEHGGHFFLVVACSSYEAPFFKL
jgi:hypothetical protein